MRIAKRIGTVETEVQDLFNRDKQTNVRMDALAGPKEKVAPEVAKAKVEAAKAKVCRTPPLPILYDVDPRHSKKNALRAHKLVGLQALSYFSTS